LRAAMRNKYQNVRSPYKTPGHRLDYKSSWGNRPESWYPERSAATLASRG
jgi:hypothetical protein